MNNESSFDELIDGERILPERPRQRHSRAVRRRALLLLAASLSVAAVFLSGYVVGDHRGKSARGQAPVRTVSLRGTAVAPHARARVEAWHSRHGNLPMSLSVVGLPKLPPDTYYEVDLVRGGKLWGSCGTFRVARAADALTLRLNAPFALWKGDSWVVTRQVQGRESGVTVLRPI